MDKPLKQCPECECEAINCVEEYYLVDDKTELEKVFCCMNCYCQWSEVYHFYATKDIER